MSCRIHFSSPSIAFVAGCVLSLSGACAPIDEPQDQSRQRLVSGNGVSANGLNLNGLGYSTLGFGGSRYNILGYDGAGFRGNNYDGLSRDGLVANHVWQHWMTSPGHIEQASLFGYVVQCALAPGQVIEPIELDGAVYGPWEGVLGLAPEWYEEGNDHQTATEQQLVSACLIAHVNAFGEHVSISVRSPYIAPASPWERAGYTAYEGQFFGNVLGESPLLGACRSSVEPGAASSAQLRQQRRVCADTPQSCRFEDFGACADACTDFDPADGTYASCAGYPAVSVHLRGDQAQL